MKLGRGARNDLLDREDLATDSLSDEIVLKFLVVTFFVHEGVIDFTLLLIEILAVIIDVKCDSLLIFVGDFEDTDLLSSG